MKKKDILLIYLFLIVLFSINVYSKNFIPNPYKTEIVVYESGNSTTFRFLNETFYNTYSLFKLYNHNDFSNYPTFNSNLLNYSYDNRISGYKSTYIYPNDGIIADVLISFIFNESVYIDDFVGTVYSVSGAVNYTVYCDSFPMVEFEDINVNLSTFSYLPLYYFKVNSVCKNVSLLLRKADTTGSYLGIDEFNLLQYFDFNPNNTLPYIESITPLNRNIELCDDSVYFNYIINAIDEESDIIYYSSTRPTLYNQEVAINTYFTNYDSESCTIDNNFINEYLEIDKTGYYKQNLLNSPECKGYLSGFENLTFNNNVGLNENSTFIIGLNYINGLLSNNNNNVSICIYDEYLSPIECLNYVKIDNNISIYNSNSDLITTLENFKTNSLYINRFDFYKNESRINFSFTYINTSNNVQTTSYNFSKEFNNIKSFDIKTKDFNRFLSEEFQINRIGFYGTDVIPIIDYDLNNNRSIEFLNIGSQSFTVYVTDEQGLYLNEFNEETIYINVVPCGTLLNPLNQTQDYNGQTLNIFEGLNEFKAMIKLFFISLDSIFGIEGNFFNIYWAFKTLVMIISVALCVAISSLFIQFGTKIVYFIFSVFLTLCYFFNTLLIEYSINFTMIIILNMVIALIQLVALKGGQEV